MQQVILISILYGCSNLIFIMEMKKLLYQPAALLYGG
jgi:hypothetical protein